MSFYPNHSTNDDPSGNPSEKRIALLIFYSMVVFKTNTMVQFYFKP